MFVRVYNFLARTVDGSADSDLQAYHMLQRDFTDLYAVTAA
jgi:hypothetical protein